MGSSIPWWNFLMIPNWWGRWTFWKGELHFRKTRIGWTSGLTRPVKAWHLGKHKAEAWPRLGSPWGAALWEGPEDPGGQAAQCESTHSAAAAAAAAKKASRKDTGLHQGHHQQRHRSHYPIQNPTIIFHLEGATSWSHLEYCVQFWSLIHKKNLP